MCSILQVKRTVLASLQSEEGLLSKEEERRRLFLKRELERQALAEKKVCFFPLPQSLAVSQVHTLLSILLCGLETIAWSF